MSSSAIEIQRPKPVDDRTEILIPEQAFEMVIGHVCERRVSCEFVSATEIRPDGENAANDGRMTTTGAVLYELKDRAQLAEKMQQNQQQQHEKISANINNNRRKPVARPPVFESVYEKSSGR